MKYRLNDGTVVDTKRAQAQFNEAACWDGRNQISKNTGSQWNHQRLYLSAKGRWYIEPWSDVKANLGRAEPITKLEAARWLVLNDHKLPEELSELEKEASE